MALEPRSKLAGTQILSVELGMTKRVYQPWEKIPNNNRDVVIYLDDSTRAIGWFDYSDGVKDCFIYLDPECRDKGVEIQEERITGWSEL